MSRSSGPGACAPSTSTGTPAARQAAAIASSGMTSAVSELTWSSTARRVRGAERGGDRADVVVGIARRKRQRDGRDRARRAAGR